MFLGQLLCSLLVIATESQQYYVRFQQYHNGEDYTDLNGGFLSAQRSQSSDLRTDNSTFAALSPADHFSLWSLESAGDGNYHIKFVQYHKGELFTEENGGYLTAQRYYSTDKRDEESTYVAVEHGEHASGHAGVWSLESADDLHYHIKFVRYHNGEDFISENGKYLTAQRYYPTDTRNSGDYPETYVALDTSSHAGVWSLEYAGDQTLMSEQLEDLI